MDDDDIYLLEEGEYRAKLLRETLAKCSNKSVRYISWSKWFKFANISFSMIMILISSILGVLLISEEQDYFLAALSFTMTFLQLTHQAFKIGTLGVYYRYAGIQINKMQRMLIRKVRECADTSHIDQVVDNINEELDEINMMLFSQSYGPSSVSAGSEGDLNVDHDKADIPTE